MKKNRRKIERYSPLVDEIVAHFGSMLEAATALGVSRQLIYRWNVYGIPSARFYQIETLTGKKLTVNYLNECTKKLENL